MYRYLADPDFLAAYRTKLRQRSHGALAVVVRNAGKAAQVLVDELGEDRTESFAKITAATRLLDCAFKAQTAIAVEEELADLRALMEELKDLSAVAAPVNPPMTSMEAIRKAEDDQAEAARLRVAWMTKVGMDGDAIESSLRYNRPQTVEEEQYHFELVEKMQDFEEAHQPENLLKFFAGENKGEAENVPA